MAETAALLEAYEVPPGRECLRVNMIAGIDGSTVLDGRSGGLGGSADKAVFGALRALSDCILVGAGTVRTEGYGPARLTAELRTRRKEAGLPETPAIVIVSKRVDLDPSATVFTGAAADARTAVVTTTGADTSAIEHVADVVRAGAAAVDLRAGVAALHARGRRVILCEGGPSLNADLLAAGLVDEVCLTVAPVAVGGAGRRIFGAADLEDPVRFDLAHVMREDSYLFLRYVRLG